MGKVQEEDHVHKETNPSEEVTQNVDAVLETSVSSISIQETRVVPDEITGSASLVQEAVQFTQAALEQNDGQDVRKDIAKLLSANRAMLFIEGPPEEPKSNFSKVIVDLFRRDNIRFGHYNVLEDNAIRQD